MIETFSDIGFGSLQDIDSNHQIHWTFNRAWGVFCGEFYTEWIDWVLFWQYLQRNKVIQFACFFLLSHAVLIATPKWENIFCAFRFWF